MPEYLAPGVYVEETSFRSKSIEGVSTTTTGFVGPARYGPVDAEPDIITSLSEFERVHGDGRALEFGDAGPQHNYLWHAVRAFFEEGGKRLYVARVFKPRAGGDGRASAQFPAGAATVDAVSVRARFPGAAGGGRVQFQLRFGQNLLTTQDGNPALSSLLDKDLVWIGAAAPPPPPPPAGPAPEPGANLQPAELKQTFDDIKALKANFAEQAGRFARKAIAAAEARASAVERDALAKAASARAAQSAADAKAALALVLQQEAAAARASADDAADAADAAEAAAAVVNAAGPATAAEKAAATAAAAAAATAAAAASAAADAARAAATAADAEATTLKAAAATARAAADAARASAIPLRQQANELAAALQAEFFAAPPVAVAPASAQRGKLFRAQFRTATAEFEFVTDNPADTLTQSALTPGTQEVRVATLTVVFNEPSGTQHIWDGLAPEPGHTRAGAADAVADRLTERPANLTLARTLPLAVVPGASLTTGLQIVRVIFDGEASIKSNQDIVFDPAQPAYATTYVELAGGNDGDRPEPAEYEGVERGNTKTGLKALEDIEDISIVAAPGSTFGLENGFAAKAQAITNALISHAQRMRYRIAVLDAGDGQSIAAVRAHRAKLDSTHAALYYPWVRVLDPITRAEINLPPSGFVAGIYARNDIQRAVYKAPANEVVNLAIGFEQTLNKAQQEVLNPEGINCFRYFEGRGYRLWGARTISSDPEWKYVNLRRYFAYLERSIDKGTQWAVFEPNGEALWANVRRTIEDFLLNEWQSGALLGDKPERAFFVKCDRSTMTQNDLDNGRLICLIGVAPLRPAEFVIFRIGQWTADRKV